MGHKRIIGIAVITYCLIPSLSALVIDSDSTQLSSLEEPESSRLSRQFSFITNPFRRVANSTRTVIKYIREYIPARLSANGTTPAPQTNVGKRVVPYLQHVTLDNIKHAINSFANSDAAPAIGGFFQNLDRDTLQLFNSHGRTNPPLILKLRTTTLQPTTRRTRTRTRTRNRNSTISTTPSSGNATKIEAGGNSTGSSAVTTTIATAEGDKSTIRYAPAFTGDDINSKDKNKENVQENEEDEEDSTEDD